MHLFLTVMLKLLSFDESWFLLCLQCLFSTVLIVHTSKYEALISQCFTKRRPICSDGVTFTSLTHATVLTWCCAVFQWYLILGGAIFLMATNSAQPPAGGAREQSWFPLQVLVSYLWLVLSPSSSVQLRIHLLSSVTNPLPHLTLPPTLPLSLLYGFLFIYLFIPGPLPNTLQISAKTIKLWSQRFACVADNLSMCLVSDPDVSFNAFLSHSLTLDLFFFSV